MDNRVSALRVDAYELPLLTEAVRRHFDALDVWAELKPGMSVLLKPNLLARYSPEACVTTNPAVVEAVAAVLREHGVTDITLADSPGGPYAKGYLESVYRGAGLTAIAERSGIKLNTDTATVTKAATGNTMACRSFNLIRPVAEADYIVNLAKLKTHGMMMMSGAVKNLFGSIPGLQKPELHLRFPGKDSFARMLLDLALLVSPGVTLVDAVDGMEGDGPAGGTPRHAAMTFAGKNLFALDLALSEFMAFRPEEVYTVAEAVKAGLCPPDPAAIEWLLEGRPEPIASYKHPASKPMSFSGHVPKWLSSPVRWFEGHLLSPRPVVDRRKCVGCGKCAESCAPKAMTIRDKKASLDLAKCIRCYCCHEMCAYRAIRIKRLGR